jgi:hypothetical protein
LAFLLRVAAAFFADADILAFDLEADAAPPLLPLCARQDGQFSFLFPSRPVSSHPHHLC